MKEYRSLFLLAVVPTTLLANENLEEAIVTASPLEKSEQEIIGSFNILDEEALQRDAAATLGETLKNQTGIHSSSFGPGVGVPVIRGQSGIRVSVLQNGNFIGDVSEISSDHAVASEALLADRIEILRGPATLRYGPGAIGGVVNIIDTRIHLQPYSDVSGGVEVRYNDNNSEEVLIGRIDAGFDNFVFHFDGVTRNADDTEIDGFANDLIDPASTTSGFIDNSDREADSFAFGASYVTDSVSGGLSVSSLESEYGIAPVAADDDERVRLDIEQLHYEGRLAIREIDGFFDTARLDLSYTDYEHVELEIEDGDAEQGTLFDSETLDLRAEIVHEESGGWRGAFGFHYTDRDIAAVGEEAFVPPAESENIGLFVVEETDLDFGTLELGIRYDRQTVDSSTGDSVDNNVFNASAALNIPLDEQNRLGVVLTRSERSPVAQELLSDGEHVATGTYEVGDINLDTESAINLEAGWVRQGAVTLRASLFYNQFSDFIFLNDTGLLFDEDIGASSLANCALAADFADPAAALDAPPCLQWSQEDASFTGVEVEASFGINDQQTLKFWGDLVSAEFDDNGDVPRTPPARLGGKWEYSEGSWNADLSVTHAFEQDNPGINQNETDSYTRIDAYLAYNADSWTVFFKGDNLADTEIRNATSYTRDHAPESGRSLTVGARYQF